MSPKMPAISLSELVTSVADELRKIKTQAPKPGEEVIKLANCDIELAVEAAVEGNAGIKFHIIELGGKGSVKGTHKITLKFGVLGNVQAVAATTSPSGGEPVVIRNPNK